MTSRRRQPADRSRHICEDGDRGERRVTRERTGDNDRETPKKSGKKLSRTGRTRSSLTAAASSSSSVPPGSEREEEPCPNKKTPKQISRCQPWTSSFNSPSNDGDQQQDIFWDPHSPTTFKLENGKRRQAANRCTVDISDIVNRIAPKNEKPSNSDAAYLGFWIGENAIPCTPVVTRTRTKMPRSRILQTEEELLKLARQLDNNLVKQKDQSEEQAANSEEEMFSGGHAGNNEDGSFLEDLPEVDDIAHVLKSVSQTSAPQRSSQKSVDQEAEAAFNALFDSSTQKYSGHLSQGFSDVSTSSLNEAPVNARNNVQEITGHNRREPCSESHKKTEQCSLASKFPTSTSQGVSKCSAQNKEKEPVQTVSSSQDDFEDDWGNDLLEDDSFIMQVTQNPELIATPKNSMASNKTNALHSEGEVKSTVIHSTSSKINNFKFVPRNVNSGSDKPNTPCSIEMTSIDISRGNSRGTNNAKSFSSTQTRVPSKPQTNVGGHNTKNNNVHNLAPATQSTFTKASQKPSDQTAPQTRATTVTKDSVPHDEWDDLKFSDEVLDMFCESDSLWEEKEDDDDLLYQVCDDVEKLTQAQEVGEVNLKKDTAPLPSSTCQMFAKSGNTSQQNKYGSNIVASSFLGSNKPNNRGVPPASFSGNCSSAYQNTSLQKSNQTFSRSNSVPSGGECKDIILTSTHTQNPAKSLDATCSAKDTLAPSKYSFTRVKPSQVPSVHVAQSAAGNQSAYNGLHSQSFGDSRNGRDTIGQYNSGSISKPQQSLIKRHLSESTIQASKVFVSEDKNNKCSMEEIERKKQEALARRKMKARASSGDTAPT